MFPMYAQPPRQPARPEAAQAERQIVDLRQTGDDYFPVHILNPLLRDRTHTAVRNASTGSSS